MSSVVLDLVEGTVQRTSDGWQAERVAWVKMSPGGDPAARPYQAAQVSRVPQYGDPHPAIPGIRVSNVTVSHDETKDPLVFAVNLQYAGDSSTPGLEGSGIKAIDVQSGTVTAQTYLDYAGNTMLVVFKGPEFQTQATSVTTEGTGSLVTYPTLTSNFTYRNMVLDAEYEVPTVTVTVTTEANRPSHVASIAASGKTNNGTWSGLGAGKWLCLGIDSSKNQAGRFDWRHQLAIAPAYPKNDTWRFRAEPILRQNIDGTASYSTQNTLGNGIEFFDLYQPVNFKKLFPFNLPS